MESKEGSWPCYHLMSSFLPVWELRPQDSESYLGRPRGVEAEGPGWALTYCSPQVKDCTDHAVLPMDGATLAEVMRQRGINMRYLGKVLDLVLRSPARDQLDHIYVSGIWVYHDEMKDWGGDLGPD